MNRKASLAVLCFAALSLVAATDSWGQSAEKDQGPLSSSYRADWVRRLLSINIRLDMKAADIKLPEGRLEAERLAERGLPKIAGRAIFKLPVDARQTLGESLLEGRLDTEALLDITEKARPLESSFSRDLRYFTMSYEIPFEPLVSLYFSGGAPLPYPRPLAWGPSRAYSGIIIYAKGLLEVRGENAKERLRPALFPRIYDEAMNRVLDAAFVDIDILTKSGPLGYAFDLDARSVERVGGDPARIMAQAIFGNNRCDIIISHEDYLRIFSHPDNGDIIRKGRILVIIDRQ